MEMPIILLFCLPLSNKNQMAKTFDNNHDDFDGGDDVDYIDNDDDDGGEWWFPKAHLLLRGLKIFEALFAKHLKNTAAINSSLYNSISSKFCCDTFD